jgi:hypothetical protein
MSDHERLEIPPRGRVQVAWKFERVRHGWDVLAQIRDLRPLTEDQALLNVAGAMITYIGETHPEQLTYLSALLEELGSE